MDGERPNGDSSSSQKKEKKEKKERECPNIASFALQVYWICIQIKYIVPQALVSVLDLD